MCRNPVGLGAKRTRTGGVISIIICSLKLYPFASCFSPAERKTTRREDKVPCCRRLHMPISKYYTAKQKPPYQRSGKAACQPGAKRQAKLNQTHGPAVGAARIVPRVCALLARCSFRLALS